MGKPATVDEVKRLAFVRYLLRLALSQSREPFPMKAASLLTFHDAVELFLGVACEHHGVGPKDRTTFEQYFQLLHEATPPLALAEEGAMVRLNKARVNLKHYGNLPAAESIEAFRASVDVFFELNTKQVFGLELSAVSMVDLIADAEVREILREAERLIREGRGSESMARVSEAFPTLLHNARGRRPPDRGFGVRPGQYRAWNLPTPEACAVDPDSSLGRYLADAKHALMILEREVDVIGMGLDFEGYQRFSWMSYPVDRTEGGGFRARADMSAPLPQNSEDLLDFVVDCALRLQARRQSR